MHPFVLGELACGNLKSRRETLRLLANLPIAPKASDAEGLQYIESHKLMGKLMGKGIGLIDAHLLAATALATDAELWSHDKRLAQQARTLKLDYQVE